MKIVRKNTLPQYSLLSKRLSGIEVDGYQHHEVWQYQPLMGVNVKNELSKEDYELTEEYIKKYKNEVRNIQLTYSVYNLEEKYDDGVHILVNTLTEAVVVLTEEEYSLFIERPAINCMDFFVVKMYQLGFYVRENDSELFKQQILRGKSAYASDDAINITIYPTQVCNARCYYCFEYGEKQTPMSKETADQTIKYICDNVSPEDEIIYRWFGGEPLIGEKTIDYIIDGVNKAFDGKIKYSSIITTNGFLLSEELIVKMKEKWHLRKIHLTIDGYREEHNRRKNYYNQEIDAYSKLISDMKVLIDNKIHIVCRFNLDKINVIQMDDILDDLAPYKDSSYFYMHVTTLRCPPKDDISKYYTPEDFDRMYDYVWDKLFEKGFYKSIEYLLPLRQRGNCMAGVMNEIMINSEGNLFKCLQHSVEPDQKVGDVWTGIVFNSSYINWMQINLLSEECRNCVYMPLCGGGCKEYRLQNREGVSPCTREKFYMKVVFDLVHKMVTKGRCEGDNEV